MNEKLCTKCNRYFPATVKYFNRNYRGKYGLASICRGCAKNYNRDNRRHRNHLKNATRKLFQRKFGKNYNKLHEWLKNHKRKSEICEICGKVGFTEFSNISGKYAYDINDYRELCRSCHKKQDLGDNNLILTENKLKRRYKLTDLQVHLIRVERLQGVSLNELASKYGVSRDYVNQICNNKKRLLPSC